MEILMALILFFVVFYSSQIIRKNLRNFRYATLIRSIIFYIPFLLPLIFFNDYVHFGQGNMTILSLIISIVVSIIGILIHLNDYKIYLNKDIYYLIQPIPFSKFAVMESSLIFSVIAEEIFYRKVLGDILSNERIITIISVVSVLFVLSHYLQEDTRKIFNKKTYLTITILSVGWTTSYLLSGNIIIPIIGHFLFNLPNMIITMARYYLPKRYQSSL